MLATIAAFCTPNEDGVVAVNPGSAFPALSVSGLVAGPGTGVALVLTWAAALTHLAWLSL